MLMKKKDYEYKEADNIMKSVGRSEFVVDGFENRIEEELGDLIQNIPEQYISVFRDVGVNLKALAGTLVKLSSRHKGDIRVKLNEVIEDKLKTEETYQLNKNTLKELIEDAIHTVVGLIAELDRLLNIEDEVLKNSNQNLKYD